MSSVQKYQPYYTISDYQLWEGDWELWFGTAVSMSPSPFGPHERAVSKLVGLIDSAISLNKCDCCVYAGLDWIVSNDTVVRPDVMLVCGEQPQRHLETPPSLAIEILSNSTRDKDLNAKRELYQSQGVEHYLIVDTDAESIIWLELQSNHLFQNVSDRISETGGFVVRLKNGCFIEFDHSRIFVSKF